MRLSELESPASVQGAMPIRLTTRLPFCPKRNNDQRLFRAHRTAAGQRHAGSSPEADRPTADSTSTYVPLHRSTAEPSLDPSRRLVLRQPCRSALKRSPSCYAAQGCAAPSEEASTNPIQTSTFRRTSQCL